MCCFIRVRSSAGILLILPLLSVPENVQDFFWMAQVTVRSPMPTVSKKNVLQTRSLSSLLMRF